MNLLAPLFLFGALAIAAPIAFHLIRRTTRERAVFSSLMFLQPTPPRLSRRHRFEHLLLLILRCAALLLLAFAFTRPFFKRAVPLIDAGAPATQRLILVDVSASMRRVGLWEAAKRAVAAQLRQAAPGDAVALYTFAAATTPRLGFEAWQRLPAPNRVAALQGALDQLTPSWEATHLGAALTTAAEALVDGDRTGTMRREIVLISDLQAGSKMDGLQGYEWPKGLNLVVVPVGTARRTNAGVQWVAGAVDEANVAEDSQSGGIRRSRPTASTAGAEKTALGARGAGAGDECTRFDAGAVHARMGGA